MTSWPGSRAASWSAAVLCRFPSARLTAPEDWRTPQARALPVLSAEAPGERRRNVTALPEATRLQTLRAKFEELHDTTHPLRQALEKLSTLETIRIIEGKS